MMTSNIESITQDVFNVIERLRIANHDLAQDLIDARLTIDAMDAARRQACQLLVVERPFWRWPGIRARVLALLRPPRIGERNNSK